MPLYYRGKLVNIIYGNSRWFILRILGKVRKIYMRNILNVKAGGVVLLLNAVWQKKSIDFLVFNQINAQILIL